MGMSASQARLLSLTARLSDLEFESQQISNAKIRLADSSAEASQKYLEALDKKKLTALDSDTGKYVDATAYNLTTFNAISEMDKQRLIKTAYGQVVVSEDTEQAYLNIQTLAAGVQALNATGYPTVAAFLTASGVVSDPNAPGYKASLVNYYTNIYTGQEAFLNSMGYTSATDEIQELQGTDSAGHTFSYYQGNILNGGTTAGIEYNSAAVTYYQNVVNEMSKNGYAVQSNSNMHSYEWLYSQFKNGNMFLYTDENQDGEFKNVPYSSGDSSIAEEKDETEVARAEAEYETTMAEIQSKDKKYDMNLKRIDTEHNAIQTEMDSVQKVMDKNIERTFKIFDA